MLYKQEYMECPYCNKPAQWVENKIIYGRNYGESFMCWLCVDCNAYVGCHQNTRKPLGTMANKELRWWRREAHLYIDQFWKMGKMSRDQVYKKMKEKMGREIHIGESDIETCQTICNLTL